ncbi:hypothetical protein LZ495_20440 [Yinghuangia sp. KLBMP8922]|uniref:Uncharacterized protein n=1 Tax=Yinghuangia soli TaxID=2908204 RepID=A0AA41Q111_9ACTN|nr:hypothetical protein [Yinghuangia soli]
MNDADRAVPESKGRDEHLRLKLRFARGATGAIVAMLVAIAAFVGYGLFSLPESQADESPPDVEQVARSAAAKQAREAATLHIDEAFAKLARELAAAGFQARTGSVSDVCGSERLGGWLASGARYDVVTCQREVVQYYVGPGPRAEKIGQVADALQALGLYAHDRAEHDIDASDCPPRPGSAVSGLPVATDRLNANAKKIREPGCRLTETSPEAEFISRAEAIAAAKAAGRPTKKPTPSTNGAQVMERQLDAQLRDYVSVGVPFDGRQRPLQFDVVSADSIEKPDATDVVSNDNRPLGTSVLSVSLRITYLKAAG